MDAYRMLFAIRLPALLTTVDAAMLLGLHPDAVRHLVKIGILEALGETEGQHLRFDSDYIRGLCRDLKWKRKAITAWRLHIKVRNQEQRAKGSKKDTR